MVLTILLCLLFFFGYLALRRSWQALAFLAIGAGYQTLTYLLPAPGGAAVTFETFVMVSLSSLAGCIAWRVSRSRMADGLFSRHRLGIFAGVAANLALALLILWQTGTLTFGG